MKISSDAASRTGILAGVCSALLLVSVCHAAPRARDDRLTSACRTAKAYLGYLGTTEFKKMAPLFAAEVDYTGADGTKLHTREEIIAAYERVLGRTRSHPNEYRLANLAPFGNNGCLMEFEIRDDRTGLFAPVAVDHFQVNARGETIRFLPYFQSAQLSRVTRTVEAGR